MIRELERIVLTTGVLAEGLEPGDGWNLSPA